MFSRLAPVGTQGLVRSLLNKHQPSSVVILKCEASQTPAQTATTQDSGESSKRDLVNFPRRVRAEYSPATRLGFIPESWFQFLYPKTGVTGPYMLGIGVVTYMMSKEIMVMDHNFNHMLSFIIALTIVHQKFGDKIGELHNNIFGKEEREMNMVQEQEKEFCRKTIEHCKASKFSEETLQEVFKAKRENVLLQMEAAHRERLEQVYKKAKQILDYHVELINIEKRIEQKNLYDYVMRNVLSSITAEQEKLALQSCIKDLNDLAARG